MEMSLHDDTIVAVSTPPGRGGIGMVRLSGVLAQQIAGQMVVPRSPLAHATARLARVPDPADAQAMLDEALVTLFEAPRSYTGEDVVEIAAHGSPVVMETLVRGAIALGARLARPGEFTERAFSAGKIDLTQAEAVRDLIDAETLYQARVAAGQLGGGLSRKIAPVKEGLAELIALLEAGIDFAEDDIDVTGDQEILTRISTVTGELEVLERSFRQGRLVHGGLTLAIVGRPNAGKSSLFNRLVENERAIVTASPGTTRDLVKERVQLGGIPLELVDTAGLREAADEAEAIGVERSREALAEAQLLLVVLDATEEINEEERRLLATLEGRAAVVAVNKTDLAVARHLLPIGTRVIETSAKTGAGLAELRAAILAAAGSSGEQETGMLTNLRQNEAVKTALDGLRDGANAVREKIPHEMVLLDLYRALWALDSLTGQTTTEDLLGMIFSRFCIGK
jgi:tRNA modification GTPase